MRAPGGFRAVVVDDWPLLRGGVSLAVGQAGGRVVADCGDPVAALAAVRNHRPDLLVVGEHGGSVETPELVRRAASIVPEVRCLALVSHPAPDEFRALSAAGVRALLPRSTSAAELHDAVVRVFSDELVVSAVLVSGLFAAAEACTGVGDEDPVTSSLTVKEREVLRLVAAGRSNAEIAGALFVSQATVKTHLAHIYEKLGVRGRYEALTRAVALGLVG